MSGRIDFFADPEMVNDIPGYVADLALHVEWVKA